jgi:queuine/archaeosine tRNA-ribosyltransferase
MMADVRQSIENGQFADYKQEFLGRYLENDVPITVAPKTSAKPKRRPGK